MFYTSVTARQSLASRLVGIWLASRYVGVWSAFGRQADMSAFGRHLVGKPTCRRFVGITSASRHVGVSSARRRVTNCSAVRWHANQPLGGTLARQPPARRYVGTPTSSQNSIHRLQCMYKLKCCLCYLSVYNQEVIKRIDIYIQLVIIKWKTAILLHISKDTQ